MLRHRHARLAALLVIAALILIAAACAVDGDAEDAAALGPEHVHGLGINPTDGALLIATHTGLFRMPEGEDSTRRVGDSLQDTMGFAVVEPDRFLGSGHPDLRDGLPPLLGLIESSDGGRSWTPISLLGEADFHALRVAGERVVAYDASGGRVMTSEDRGRSWQARRPPEPLHDLVPHPAEPEVLIAAGPGGLHRSFDAGATWGRSTTPAEVVALAWPAEGALYALGLDGRVWSSADGGRSWAEVGELGGEPAAVTAVSDASLIVALHDGRIVRSDDGARTWSAGAWPA